MSQEQESVQIYLWGFIETRRRIPAVIEAYGDLTGEFAVMNSNERAVELGFSASEARDVNSVLAGKDSTGSFEVRQMYLDDVEVNGTHVLFEEANDLADAVARLLAVQEPLENADQIKRVLTSLAAYDRRWGIRRG